MGYPIKQSQTAQPLVFLLVSSTDHIAGLTGATVTVTLSKNGGTFASPSGAVTEIGSGWYKVAGNATDSGTLGPLLLHATATGADPVDDRYDVVAYDPQATSLGLSLAKTTNITGFNDIAATAIVSGGAITTSGGAVSNVGTTGTVTSAVTLPTIPTDWIAAAGVKADAVTKIQSGLATPTNITAATGIVLSGVTHTGAIIPTVTNLTNAPTAGDFTATMKTSLNAATPASVTGAVGSVTGNVGGNVTGSVGSVATGGITAASLAANAITAAKIATDAIGAAQLAADAVTEIQSGLSTYAGGDTSGTTTLLSRLTATRAGYIDNLSAGAVALASQIPANFTTATFASAGVFATAALANAPGGSAPSAATVAAAVWDLTTTGHTTAGTFGNAMNAAGSAGDPWSTSLPGAYSAGSAGYIVGHNIDALISSRMATFSYTAPDNTSITAIKAKTDNLPASPASTTNITAGTITTVTNLTNAPTAGDFTATMKTSITTAATSATPTVTVGTITDKTGYSLSSTGLDSIAVTAPTGVATTFPQMVVQTWRRFFKKATRSTTQIKTFADDGTTTVTTQTISDDGSGNEVQGVAS